MPYSDPKRAEEYWAYCMTNDAKCQRLPECLKAARCLSGGPYPVSYPNSSCQAYDYCPKREACLAASRCLDARAGPPRRLSLKTTDIAKEYTNSSSLTHKPLTEVPEDRKEISEGLQLNPFDVGKPAIASDTVNHPNHYTSHPSGIECIQVTRHMNFNRGNAVKYIWRAGEKSDELEDLKKARWYLDDEIKRLEAPSGKTKG